MTAALPVSPVLPSYGWPWTASSQGTEQFQLPHIVSDQQQVCQILFLLSRTSSSHSLKRPSSGCGYWTILMDTKGLALAGMGRPEAVKGACLPFLVIWQGHTYAIVSGYRTLIVIGPCQMSCGFDECVCVADRELPIPRVVWLFMVQTALLFNLNVLAMSWTGIILNTGK